MKKTLLFTALAALLNLACTSNDESEFIEETASPLKTQVVTYTYAGKNYSLKFDVTDEENSILLEGKDNEILADIYQKHDQLVTVYENDSTLFLYNDMPAYEKSNLFAENERKAEAFKKSMKTSKSLDNTRNNVRIAAQNPPLGSNFTAEAYLYRRSQLRFDSRGYYVKVSPGNASTYRDVPNFKYSNSSSFFYGDFGGSLFPEYDYITGGPMDHDDAFSSLYVNLMKLTIYRYKNYSGQAVVFDARANPNARKRVKNLKDLKFS